MQFTITILALAAGASVAMAQVNPALCAGRVAQCCQLDVLDLAAISCENPPNAPQTLEEFDAACGETGVTAQCCVLPILGQALLCNSP
ncbi:hypothetical protein Q7P36_007958 [Cladosporium allicinum]